MRKMISLLGILLLIGTKSTFAQFVEAQQCIGGSGNDIITDVQKTNDGGLIVLVNTSSNDGDFSDNTGVSANALIKLNSNYEIEWKKTYEYSGAIINAGLFQYNQGYFLQYFSLSNDIIDSLTMSPTFYYNLICLDTEGKIKWQKQYLADGTTSGSFYFYYLNYAQFQPITLLSNNTIAYSTLVDSTISVHNVDTNGNILWELSFNYDTIFRNSYNGGGWGFNYNLFENNITELNDNSLLLINSLQDYCFWFCWPMVHKSHFINIDYNGNLIKENYSDTAISYLSNIVKEEADEIYISGISSSSVYKLNKNNLTIEQQNYYYGQIINFSDYIFNSDTAIQNNMALCLYPDFDSVNNYYRLFIQKVDLFTSALAYRTLLDTLATYNFMANISAYALPQNEYLIIYAKYNEYKIVKINQSGNIVYNKLLSPSIRINENIYGSLPYQSPYYYFFGQFKSYNVADNNKFYSYNTWSKYDSVFNNSITQKFFIHNLATGELEYEFINNMQDSLAYKFIAPYPDKKNELFVLADLNGQNTCRLGGFDIIMAKTITATNKILGKAFIDYNSNQQKETGEPQYTLAYLESTKGNYSLSTYLNGNNYALNYTDTGTWTTRLIPHHNYYDINPVSFISSHTTFGNSDTIIFAMHPRRVVNDLKVSLVNTFITRLGNFTTYEIAYANEGTHTANGTIKLVLDSRLNFSYAVPANSAQNGDTLIWDFSNLLVNETRKISMHSIASVPPVLQVGDSLHSIVFIEPLANDSTPNDNQATLDEVVPGSYDPNDKTSTTGEYITPSQIQQGDYITYVIRFQNTGNDTAFRIVIEDTLDANLDWSTLQPINTSHPFSMQVVNKNIIQFTFSNMKLPPASINEPASHGFIAYKVKPKAELSQGSTIKNTAHIYFDFNAPITTNTVSTQVALLSAIKNNNNGEAIIAIYPNPNNGIFNLEFTAYYSSPLAIAIMDITGKTIYENKLQHQFKSVVSIHTEGLSAGLYTVLFKTDKETQAQKIIIDK